MPSAASCVSSTAEHHWITSAVTTQSNLETHIQEKKTEIILTFISDNLKLYQWTHTIWKQTARYSIEWQEYTRYVYLRSSQSLATRLSLGYWETQWKGKIPYLILTKLFPIYELLQSPILNMWSVYKVTMKLILQIRKLLRIKGEAMNYNSAWMTSTSW